MKHFPLDKNYAILLDKYRISMNEVLKKSNLPLDLFARVNFCNV